MKTHSCSVAAYESCIHAATVQDRVFIHMQRVFIQRVFIQRVFIHMQDFVLHCGCIWRLILAVWLHMSLVAAYEWRFCLALRLHMNEDSGLRCGCVWVLHCGCIYGWKRSLALWLKTQSCIVATYEWRPSLALWVDRALRCGSIWTKTRSCKVPAYFWWISHVTHLNESCHTFEWVMPHTWMSHVTHLNESYHAHKWIASHAWKNHATLRS